MASGLAIVAAYAPSSREVLGDDGGVVVPPTDPSAFASAILDLVRDHGPRDRLASRAVLRARSFSWDQIFDDLLADYRRVIAASRAPSARSRRL
jgi:glycosyltransferase involved in cell wall biosynthesis